MNGDQLIETLERAETQLVELSVPAENMARFVQLCEEAGVGYRIPAVRVIVPRRGLLDALMRARLAGV